MAELPTKLVDIGGPLSAWAPTGAAPEPEAAAAPAAAAASEGLQKHGDSPRETPREQRDLALDEAVARTQKELGAIISAPPLTGALLRRPPFRFMHDVVSAVTAATGFAEGLFAGDELDAAALTERNARLDFIAKIVGRVEEESGIELAVSALGVITGKDAATTNTFLQTLAKCGAKAWHSIA